MLNEDILKEFIFECEMRRLSPRTITSYRNANLRMMKYIKEQYGIKELEKTHHLAIKGYIQYMTEQKISEVYINRNIVCYKCFFEYCVREGYISTNPINKVNKQKEPVKVLFDNGWRKSSFLGKILYLVENRGGVALAIPFSTLT